MKNKHFVVTLFFIIIGSLLNAQSHNEEVTVEGSYTPQIQKSERIIKTPDMPKRDFNIPSYEINTEDFLYQYKIDLEPVSPLTYNYNKTVDITNNFIKAGIGTRLSPDFLFRHYSNITKRTSLGIGVTHNSTWTGMKDYPDAKYMNNEFSASMTNRLSQFQLHSHVRYNYDMYHINASEGEGLRKIHSFNVMLAANNNKSSYKSLYDEFILDYNYSGIHGGMQENLLSFKAHIEHTNSWFMTSNNMQTLSFDIDADLDNIKETLFLIAVNPHLDFDGDYYNIRLGLRIDAKTNSTSMGGLYPDIKGSLYLFNRNLEFYAGLGGKTKINTLKEIIAENPFIVSDLTNIGEFDYEKTKFDFQGGLKFKALNKISGNVGVRYRSVYNHIFYYPAENPSTFNVNLADCRIFNLMADVHLRISDKIKAAADFKYNQYDKFANAEKNWYKPKTEFRLRGFYRLNDLWNFNIAAYVEGKRDAINFDKEAIVLKPICDIQAACDYNYKENLSFYAEVKNLIHNKYQIYYGYPSYGFQMFLGFKYRFL